MFVLCYHRYDPGPKLKPRRFFATSCSALPAVRSSILKYVREPLQVEIGHSRGRGSGKTAVTQMFVTDGGDFPKNYTMTFTPEVSTKVVRIHGTDDRVEFLIYDSPGLDLYKDQLSRFWKRPDMLMVVFDVSNRKSLDFAGSWHKIAMEADWTGVEGRPVATVLFGNKVDHNSRVCTEEDAEVTAQNIGAKYFSGSAKDNQGLDEVFYHLAGEFHKFSMDQ